MIRPQQNPRSRCSGFLRDMRGNVAMLFSLTVPVLLFASGVAIDYSNAQITHSRLNAAADAAALAAVNASMITQTDAAAQAAAVAMFRARSENLTPLVSGSFTDATVTISHPNGSTLTRLANVQYTEQVSELFGGIFNFFHVNSTSAGALQVSGSSSAEASAAANVNFYLLLDNSPSMSLPASSTGISNMESYTTAQGGGGCAFACHQGSTGNGDTAGNLCYNGTGYVVANSSNNETCPTGYTQIDNYGMARHYGIQLKLDELTNGITTLMSTAQTDQNSTGQSTPPVWQFAAYTMDTSWAISQTSMSQPSESTSSQGNYNLMPMTTSYVSGWTTAQTNFGVMEMWANNQTCGNAACTSGGSTGDVATNLALAMSSINGTMPNPGAGTNATGDTPQEVLFIVTDGVQDAVTSTCSQPWSGNRCQSPIDQTMCTTIKNRGIKIAILYTEYLAVTSNSWYVDWIQPFQSSIGPDLQNCASTGLFYDATVDTNLGAALVTLFNKVLQQSPSLTQ